MGKKVKTGKARKDKYYHLAKETGYRSRAAFKLLQLDRKYKFLEKSRVCIDLCAAPGGWLQVAAQHMPMSSLILGVDLVSIKPIPNTVTFQEDITSEKCRQTLKKELQTWKADLVLHDGAPNVGKNWLHDAYQQAELTLQALKLATQFLKRGGWFITKVFRSKDYTQLLWAFEQFFKRVYATKPKASRNESAEIFVVCQWFRAPAKADAKLTDPKFVFREEPTEKKLELNLLHPEKHRRHRDGYDETDTAFHHKLSVSKFLSADNHLELLADTHQVVFDDPEVLSHPLTELEIQECCKDIKVLGKKELRSLLSWRKKMKQYFEDKKKEAEAVDKDSDSEAQEEEEGETTDEENINEQISKLEQEQQKDKKRKRKKESRDKRKLRDKMTLKMIHPGDVIEETDDICLFDLKKIKTKQELTEVQKEDLVSDTDSEEDEEKTRQIKKVQAVYDRYGDKPDYLLDNDKDDDDSDSDVASDSEGETEEDSEEEPESKSKTPQTENPLVVDLETKDSRVKNQMDMWFNKDVFSGIEGEDDEDLELEKMTEEYKKKGGIILEKRQVSTKSKKKHVDSEDSGNVSDSDLDDTTAQTMKRTSNKDFPLHLDNSISTDSSDSDSDDHEGMQDSDSSDDSDDSGSDYDVNHSLQQTLIDNKRGDKRKVQSKSQAAKDGFEIVPATEPGERPEKVIKLDPVELAIGEELIKSGKRRREIIEMSYNRYTHGEESLPDWFAKEESKHSRKQLPVTKAQVDAYKEKMKAINARPVKKIAEAKARRKRKLTKKLERARKKAESVSDNVDLTDREKWKNMKEIYKKAGLLTQQQKKTVSYVVAKKGGGRKTVRPDGVKGRYRVVDPRMKKDSRQRKIEDKQKMKNAKSKRKK